MVPATHTRTEMHHQTGDVQTHLVHGTHVRV